MITKISKKAIKTVNVLNALNALKINSVAAATTREHPTSTLPKLKNTSPLCPIDQINSDKNPSKIQNGILIIKRIISFRFISS